MKVTHPSPQVVLVTKRRMARVGRLAFTFGFFGVWYFTLLGVVPEDVTLVQHAIEQLGWNPILWLFILVPAFALPDMLNDVKIIAQGEEFRFDGVRRAIFRNGMQIASFSEIDHVQIRTIIGEGEEHRLSAVFRSGDKIQIHESSHSCEVSRLADDIADVVDTSVVRKE